MNNFIFQDKTKVYFGKGGVKEYLSSLLGTTAKPSCWPTAAARSSATVSMTR